MKVAKEKPKRKGPIDAVPTGTEEWAVYDAPDDVIEAFAHMENEEEGSICPQGLHGKTITRPVSKVTQNFVILLRRFEAPYSNISTFRVD